MNQNKFLYILKNITLNRLLFQHIHWIHRIVQKKKDNEILKWNQLIIRPDVLSTYGYLEILQNYINDLLISINKNNNNSKNNKNSIDDGDNFFFMSLDNCSSDSNYELSDHQLQSLLKSAVNSIKYNQQHTLEYLLTCDLLRDKPKLYYQNIHLCRDLMWFAAISASQTAIQYLHTLYDRNYYDWDYDSAFQVLLMNGTHEQCNWFITNCSLNAFNRADLFNEVVESAAQSKHGTVNDSIDMIKLLLERTSRNVPLVISNNWALSIRGHMLFEKGLDLSKWIYRINSNNNNNSVVYDSDYYLDLAIIGYFIHTRNINLISDNIDIRDIVQWFIDNTSEFISSRLINSVRLQNEKEVPEWLSKFG